MFDHFGLIAPVYDRLFRSRGPQNLLSLLDPQEHGILLDAGGGTGRIGASLRPFIAQVVVADISFKMLKQAHTKSSLFPVCAPTEILPFPDNTFDRIVMVDALHHVENASLTMTELWRVTKGGGRIIIEEPDIRTSAVKILAILEKIILMRSRFISPDKIMRFFIELGAQSKIITLDYSAWIVIEKPG